MKPLQNIEAFLKRFDNFKGGEFRSIEVISPTKMIITLAGQDEARAFDWLTIAFECNNITDAKLLDATKLSLLDMSEGVSIINTHDTVAFGIGDCYNISSIKTSSIYIECSHIKYEERAF